MLAIDIGNTCTDWAVLQGQVITGRASLMTAGLGWDGMHAMVERLGVDPTVPAVIASVVPAATEAVQAALARAGWAKRLCLDPATHDIMPHALATPATTGVDRLLAARAARDRHAEGRGVVVVQAGSAVTVDLVDTRGVFQGGMILPGPGLWTQALTATAQIPAFDAAAAPWQAPEAGKSSEAAVLSGLAAGLPAAITRAVQVLAAFLPQPRTVLCGGWAEALQPALTFDAIVVPDLVLHGIGIVGRELLAHGQGGPQNP